MVRIEMEAVSAAASRAWNALNSEGLLSKFNTTSEAGVKAFGDALQQWINKQLPKHANTIKVEVVKPGKTVLLIVDFPATAEDGKASLMYTPQYSRQVVDTVGMNGTSHAMENGKKAAETPEWSQFERACLLTFLTTMVSLKASGKPHGEILLCIDCADTPNFTPDQKCLDYLTERIGDPAAVFALNNGPADSERFCLTSSMRGLIAGILTVQVMEEAAHSGEVGGIVPDSFRVARAILSRIESEQTGRLTLKELYCDIPDDAINQVSATVSVLGEAVWARFPFVNPDDTTVADHDLSELVLNNTWRPTLSVTGAIQGPSVADTALRLNLRLPPTINAASGCAAFAEALESDPPYNCAVRFEPQDIVGGWANDPPPHWLAESVERASQGVFGHSVCLMGDGAVIYCTGALQRHFANSEFVMANILASAFTHRFKPNTEPGYSQRVAAALAVVLADFGAHDGAAFGPSEQPSPIARKLSFRLPLPPDTPPVKEPTPSEREAISLTNLRNVLFDVGLRPLIDLTAGDGTGDTHGAIKPPRHVAPNTTCVVLLSEPDYRMSLALEGGRQSPGNVLVVPNPAWLHKAPLDPSLVQGEATHALYVKKGIWFDASGQCYLEERVTYFANFLTAPATEGERSDGVWLEEGINTPMSSSSSLEHVTNDKLHTRLLLSRARVAHPTCVAFTYKCAWRERYNATGTSGVWVHHLAEADGHRPLFEAALKRLTKRIHSQQIVVKPSGPMWMGSNGVSFWKREDISGAVGAVESLLVKLWEGDAILVEEFLPTMSSHLVMPAREVGLHAAINHSVSTAEEDAASKILTSLALEVGEEESDFPVDMRANSRAPPPSVSLGFRLRVMVVRSMWGEPVVTKMLCGVGPNHSPINGDNTIPMSLDAVLDQWGIEDIDFKRRVLQTVADEAGSVMRALLDHERDELNDAQRGGVGAQTDLIGLDFILTANDKIIIPAVIEVNDHDCSLQAQTLEFILPETSGDSVRPWVATMIARGENYLMRGRTVLVVGGGGYSKRFVFTSARDQFGLRVVLVDADPNHYAAVVVHKFICVPEMNDHTRDEANATKIIELMKQQGIQPEGCLTFWEDCGPLAARLQELLKTRGNPYGATCIAKSKFRTQDTLMKQKTSWPHKPITALFSAKSFRLCSEDDVRSALHELSLPAVLKLEYGSSAAGVVLVKDSEECMAKYRQIRSHLSSEEDHGGIGLGFGSSLVLMEYVEGSEHDVDIIVYDGQILAAFVTDNGPTRLPLFCETAAAMPSRLHRDKQGALVAAALQCCTGIGLKNGVFNVEDWIQRVWSVDILKAAFMIALDMRPVIKPTPEPRTHLVGAMLYASTQREALQHGSPASVARLRKMHDEGVLVFNQFEEHIPEDEEFEEPFASVGIAAPTTSIGKVQLQTLWQILGLDQGAIPVAWYLQNL
eukprot:jgi/Chlat1/375/Chrsp10S00051